MCFTYVQQQKYYFTILLIFQWQWKVRHHSLSYLLVCFPLDGEWLVVWGSDWE